MNTHHHSPRLKREPQLTPVHWRRIALKRLLSFGNGRDHKGVEVLEGGYPVYGSGGEFARASAYLYEGESVLFGRKGTIDRPLYVYEKFWTVDTMYFTCPSQEASARYLYYVALLIPYPLYSTNTALPSVTKEALGNHMVAAPPLEEQLHIARFLDHEIAKIDRLIEKQQQLIALLKEKRQAVISHAVTKGLNPGAPMKDSGVEWLGEVPAHWNTGKLKFFAELRSGHTPSRSMPEYWENCTIPWFSLADVWQLRDGRQIYLGDTAEKISELGLANSAADLLPAGTVILSRTASVGFSGIMPVPMATTQDFVNWIPGPSLVPEFLLFTFRAMSSEFDRLKMGSTHKTIYMPDVREFFCALPSLTEQREIAEYLKARLESLDEIAARCEETVRLLQERRTALISAAVTGKIDVRNWQPSATEQPAELEPA